MSHSENVIKRGRGHNYSNSRQLRSGNSHVRRSHQRARGTTSNQQQKHSKKKNTNPFIGNTSTDRVMKEITQRKLDERKQIELENESMPYSHKQQPQNTIPQASYKPNQNFSTNPYMDPHLITTFNAFSPTHNKQFIQQHQVDKQPNHSDDDYKCMDNDNHNHGWPQGWSLEQEFIQQSVNIVVKPENKKYLKKREIHDKYPRESYRRRRGEHKKHILHWGQRKLLLSEIEFLNSHLKSTKKGDDGLRLVVYAGAASGKHIPLLIEMYDDIAMHLWDPNDFCYAIKHTERVQIHQKYFTDLVAERYGRLGRDLLFISDIRTADRKRQISQECEDSIIKDNELQTKWTHCMTCGGHLVAAMLKFRLPYPHLVKESQYNQVGLDGTIKLGIWAPVTSTETRLHVKPDSNGKIHTKIYDCKVYEEQLFWFNVKCRQSFIDNTKYHCAEYGVINSYDCWAECLILEQYLAYYKCVRVTKKDVIGMVNRITKFIGGKRGLLTMPPDPEQQKRGLGIANHSYFHNNQQAANPTKYNSNQHGLIGYEGTLYIAPEQTQTVHAGIMDTLVEGNIDTWALTEVNQMLNVVCDDDVKVTGIVSVLPCYNRPMYNMICVKNNIYLIPLKGFGCISFKISPEYSEFYAKCFGDMSCCCATGFLIDNHGIITSEKEIRYELSIVDILTTNSPNNYMERRKQIECVVDNYQTYKPMVTESAIFKFIPIKLSQCPSQNGIQAFRNQIVTNFDLPKPQIPNNTKLEWNHIYFDAKKYEWFPTNGWYWKHVALNTRIGGALVIHNNIKNILYSQINFCNLSDPFLN
eukprot:92793_1